MQKGRGVGLHYVMDSCLCLSVSWLSMIHHLVLLSLTLQEGIETLVVLGEHPPGLRVVLLFVYNSRIEL